MPVLPPVAVAACALAASASALVTWWRMTAPFSPVAVAMGTVEISPGVHMPLLANGIARDHTVWLQNGGRHIDTAYLYGDDQQRKVGGAIRIFRDEVPRGQIFVTTKVTCCPSDRCSHFCDKPPNSVGLRATANVTEQIHHSLALLGVEYVDLLLLHFPCSRFEDTARAYAQLEAIHASGRARAIGVSNLNASALKALLAVAKVKPAVNQVGLSIAGHPASHDGKAAGCEEGSRRYGSDLDTVSFGRRHGVTTMAYSPLGRISHVDVLGQRRVQKAAERHKKTSAQVALRWLTQQGIAAVTATSNSQHAAEALDSSSFDLTWWEMRALSGLR